MARRGRGHELVVRHGGGAPLILALLLAGAASAQAPPVGDAAPAVAGEAELPPLLKNPELLEFVQAPYPKEAEAAGLEARVGLLVEIDAGGRVTRVEVLRPAGHGFDEAAVAAAQAFTFSPAEDETGPVPVAIEFDYGFTLAPPAPPPEAPVTAVAEAPVNLEGRLLEMATKKPVADAAVRLVDIRNQLIAETTTGADGRFSFRGVPVGALRVVTRAPGYSEEIEPVSVTAGELTSGTFWLRKESYRDAIIGAYEADRPPEITRRTLSMDEVRRVPGTFGDPVRVIQSLPGAARAPFSTGLLVIRGANPEDSNVYVDGVEVPLVYHLGGFRSILNPDLIEAVDYLPGGYGVRYGRSTGGVIDVRTQSEYPERVHTTLKTDLLDTGIYAEGRVGKVGFAVGGRRSYIDAILAAVLVDSPFYAAPRWLDYQLKLESLDSGPDDLSLLLFGFDDELIVRAGDDAEDQLGVGYSTHRLVGRWRHSFSDELRFELQPSVGTNGIKLGFGSQFGLDLTSYVLDLRTELRFTPNEKLTLSAGLDSEASRNDFAVYAGSVPVDGDDPLSETEPLSAEVGLWQTTPDPFAEAQWRPLADPERLVVVAGLRVPILIQESDGESAVLADVDPRLAVRFSPWKGSTVKGGSGLYHQPPGGVDLAGDAAFERGWSSELGWEQKFGQALSVDVTGYYRWMENLGAPTDDGGGVGRAYGMELMARHARIDRFFGWVSYTLSKSERNDDPESDEGWYPFDFDQTHILTAVSGYRLPYDLEVSGKAQYVTGNPYTPYSGGIYLMDEGGYLPYATGEPNSARQPDYWAVDARVSKLFTFKAWQLELFVDLLSVLHGENPEFPIYNYDYTEQEWIGGLPFIPSVGFQAEVYW